MDSRYEDISRRAYELFLSRGAEHGSDLNDWLEAERQLASNGSPRRSQRTVSATRIPKAAARKKTR